MGISVSVEKTNYICFYRIKVNPKLNIKLFGQELKQERVIRYLGMWFDIKLTFKEHIQKMIDKCKKVLMY